MPKAKGKTRRQKFGSRIRHARDRAAAVRQKLAEMELAIRALEVDLEGRPQELVQKPYLVDYVRCMVENHGEDWKADRPELWFSSAPLWRTRKP
ncbi:PREDICTED: nucleolar protein 16-like isoform X2 [Hipposideros armiger]|uniref:Nucleolar protein 16-like isoform X2 n=1 Tax=Hipposideros armiger TaxID=186990 RepID=A0A8B7QW53_HIPAR|nr:PREDICTED: nucleolar protein 16-like isoform X2 [Hipposideros armiger]